MKGLLSQTILLNLQSGQAQRLYLQPGQTYRARVNGHEIEVRVLETTEVVEVCIRANSKAEEVPEVTSRFEDMVMLEPWFSIPQPPPVRIMEVKIGPPILPSPYRIDESDLAPE